MVAVINETGASAAEIAKHLRWSVSDVHRVIEGRRPRFEGRR